MVSWSSGKDSAWLVHVLRTAHPELTIGALLTTINADAQRVAMHAVRTELLDQQAEVLGVPLWKVPIPSPCSNEEYERVMGVTLARAVSEGFTHMAFGDLFLEDIRRYREEQLAGTGLTPLFPLFGADTSALAREMIASGLAARITCVNPKVLDRSFAGREFDRTFLADLPPEVDPCGERGEFHSFAYAGPMFRRPIRIVPGVILERDGFVFADVIPAPSTTSGNPSTTHNRSIAADPTTSAGRR